MNTLQRQQAAWDSEARTIAAGRRAFERPAGEPSMLAGTLFVLSGFFFLAVIAAALPGVS